MPRVIKLGDVLRKFREAFDVSVEAAAAEADVNPSEWIAVEANCLNPATIRRILTYADLVAAVERIGARYDRRAEARAR